MFVTPQEYVNFSRDEELNYHIRKWNKNVDSFNRQTLRFMGKELKNTLDARHATHAQLDSYIEQNLKRLN